MRRTLAEGLTLLALVAHSLVAWANCEDRLESSFTQGTLRLLERGVIGTSEILEIVNSETPINPIRARTPGSRDSAAGRFFKAALDGGINQNRWNSIRMEMRKKLGERNIQIEESTRASEKTREVPSLILVNSNKRQENITDWSGVYYFELGKGQMHSVRSALKQEPIWQGEVPQNAHFAFTVTSGRTAFNFLRQLPATLGQKFSQWFRTKISRIKVDLETGETKDSVLWQWGKEKNIADLKRLVFKVDEVSIVRLMGNGETSSSYRYWLEVFEKGKAREESWSRLSYDKFEKEVMKLDYKLLRNGKLAVIAHNAHFEASRTKFGHIQFGMSGIDPVQFAPAGLTVDKQSIFETDDGRVLVVVYSIKDNTNFVQIFEPLKSVDPIFEYSDPIGPQRIDYGLFEYKGTVYLAVGQGFEPVAYEGSVRLFAPLESEAPLMQMSVPPFNGFRAVVGPDGVPYVVVVRATVDAYSIFQQSTR